MYHYSILEIWYIRHNYICWFLCLCRKILKVKGESKSIFFLLMLGYIQSNIEGVYNGKKDLWEERKSFLFMCNLWEYLQIRLLLK